MTRKPCPGCGEVSHSRPASGVCHECKRLLVLGAARDKYVEKERESVRVPGASHWLPYIPHQGDGQNVLNSQFTALAKLVGEHEPQIIPSLCLVERQDGGAYTGVSGDERERYTFPVGSAAAFDALHKAIVEAVRNSYRQGKKDGQDLLKQLASGETSIADFNKRSIGGA